MTASDSDDVFLQVAAMTARSPRRQVDGRGQKRELTRKKIIRAAKVQFKTKRFHFTTIDDIVSYANISRATFYTYFRGKEEVLLEIVIKEYEGYHDRIHDLVAIKSITEETITNWVIGVVESYVGHRDWLFSFYVVCDIYEEMANFFSEGRDKALGVMGQRFSIFSSANGESLDDDSRARGHMMLYQMEQFALHAAFPGWPINIRTFAKAIARSMLALLSEGETGPPITHKSRHVS